MKLTVCPLFQPQASLFEGSRLTYFLTLISPGIQVLVHSCDTQYLLKPYFLTLRQFYLKTCLWVKQQQQKKMGPGLRNQKRDVIIKILCIQALYPGYLKHLLGRKPCLDGPTAR